MDIIELHNYLCKKNNMNFFIKQNSTLPELILEVNTVNQQYIDRLFNSIITISMIEKNSCRKKIFCNFCELIEEENCNNECGNNIFIKYKFDTIETNTKGDYIAEITVTFNDNGDVLKLPVDEILNVCVF